MEMIIVAPDRPNLLQPALVGPGLAAERDLQRRVDEDALDLGLGRDGADQAGMGRGPVARIDVAPIGTRHVDRRHVLALLAIEPAARHRRQPDIGIEPDLVRGMAGQHRPAARLRYVADQQASPAGDARHVAGEFLQIIDQSGWPQLRLRFSRMTCQLGPSTGRASAPARQPRA